MLTKYSRLVSQRASRQGLFRMGQRVMEKED
jgi:hypothetical protein